MTVEEIKSYLCEYDIRNSDPESPHIIKKYKDYLRKNDLDCSCDNCFKGRTELAEELLRLYEVVKQS